MKILLAEDDLKLAEYLIAGLGEHGHSVDHVTDGRDALSYCLYNDCDIAIVDRIMAGMDDLSVVKALRAAHKELPVLFLSAMGQVDDRVEGLPAGGIRLMRRPTSWRMAGCFTRLWPAGFGRAAAIINRVGPLVSETRYRMAWHWFTLPWRRRYSGACNDEKNRTCRQQKFSSAWTLTGERRIICLWARCIYATTRC